MVSKKRLILAFWGFLISASAIGFTFNTGAFWKGSSLPPELAAFNVVEGAVRGELEVTVDFPTNTSNIDSVEIRRALGPTAPAATCTDGTVVKTYNTPTFPDPDTFSDSATPGNNYSYRVCVRNAGGDITATQMDLSNLCHDCGDRTVNGYCYYYGNLNEDCDSVCSTRGGYNAATHSYSGQGGSNGNCQNVVSAFSHGGSGSGNCSSFPPYGGQAPQAGCCRSSAYGSGRCTGSATTSSAKHASLRRYCACNG